MLRQKKKNSWKYNMETCDVLGLTLEAAMEKLNKFGVRPTIIETAPLRGQIEGEGTLRVVKQMKDDENRTLILCRIPDMYR